MKKTALSVFVSAAFAASVASAATVYDEDGLKVDLKGDLELQYSKPSTEDSKSRLAWDDVAVKLSAAYELDNGYTALAYLSQDYKGATDGGDSDSEFDGAYVGLSKDALTIKAGETDYATDEFGITKDYELAAGDLFGPDSSGDVVRVEYAADAFSLYASVDIAEETVDETTGDDIEDESSFDVVAAFDVSGASIAVAYQSFTADQDADAVGTFGISGEYSVSGVDLAAAFTSIDEEDNEGTAFNIALGADVSEEVSLAGGMDFYSPDEGDDVSVWYVNATYTMAKGVLAFAEFGSTDVEGEDELAYVFGYRVRF